MDHVWLDHGAWSKSTMDGYIMELGLTVDHGLLDHEAWSDSGSLMVRSLSLV